MIAIWARAAGVYALAGGLLLLVALMFLSLRPRPVAPSEEPVNLASLLAGVGFIRRTPVILTAITLDMFAVLFGGVTALLPVFALDILAVGATDLGWLQYYPGSCARGARGTGPASAWAPGYTCAAS